MIKGTIRRNFMIKGTIRRNFMIKGIIRRNLSDFSFMEWRVQFTTVPNRKQWNILSGFNTFSRLKQDDIFDIFNQIKGKGYHCELGIPFPKWRVN